jgi:gliding motility-associated protein GldE
MELDVDPPSLFLTIIFLSFSGFNTGLIISLFILIILIISSALISGSEIAFFSITPHQLNILKEEGSKNSETIIRLKNDQSKLLATILITNNFVNIAIVLVSDYILKNFLANDLLNTWAQNLVELPLFSSLTISSMVNIISFTITVVGVTFILVLFGEVMPKIYASVNNIKLARLMATPISFLLKVFSPVSNLMVKWTDIVERKLEKSKSSFSSTDKDEINDALDITLNSDDQELDILKSILKFSDVSVKQIMKPRIDVVAIEDNISYDEVLKIVRESGFSRIPVFHEDFDNIIGILYAKDLISHLDNKGDFNWQNLIRKNILYVPESKKINDLLKEFQKQKLHMAIVVDEYGGSAGIITMEDIMEEILGEIIDEFDEENETEYEKIDEKTYIFEGKTLLMDFVKVFDEDIDIFNDFKGESDSLAGLILEIKGDIPEKQEKIEVDKFIFIVEKVSDRRIEKIKVILNDEEQDS